MSDIPNLDDSADFFSRFAQLDVDTDTGHRLTSSGSEPSPGSGLRPGSVERSSINETLRSLLHLKGLSGFKTIYTDGSYIPGAGTGCAIYSEDLRLNICYNLNGLLSIFEAEAIAILHSLRCINESSCKSAVVMTDSLSVLSALLSFDTGGGSHPLVYCIKEITTILNQDGFIIKFIWIPAHIGIRGNEIVNALAKEGALNSASACLNPHRHFCCPNNLFRTFCDEAMELSVKMLCEEATRKGYQYFNRVKEKNLKTWFKDYDNLPRSVITLISRLRSHHVALAAHLFEKGIVDSPRCLCGELYETIEHAFECPRRGNARDWLTIKLYNTGVNPDAALMDVIFGDNREAFLVLEQFTRKFNLKL